MSVIEVSEYGQLDDGRDVQLYTLVGQNGIEVSVTNFGATVTSFKSPDKNGEIADTVLAYDDLQGYVSGDMYLGATVGRFANRIANSRFSLEGVEYLLPKNDGENHLHGGFNGWHLKLWQAELSERAGFPAVLMQCQSADGEEGYPGNVECKVWFFLNAEAALVIDCEARSDKTTPISMTHHGYFNLDGSDTIVDHQVSINASRITPLVNGVPRGEFMDVENTPFDLRQLTRVGDGLDSDHEQINAGIGFDHNWEVSGGGQAQPVLAATAQSNISGRRLQVYSNAPGIQFYTGNHMNGSASGHGVPFNYRRALCLEPQNFPDAPNQAAYPSALLRPGEVYQHTMVYALDCV
jgi:aldose 1-epimerase